MDVIKQEALLIALRNRLWLKTMDKDIFLQLRKSVYRYLNEQNSGSFLPVSETISEKIKEGYQDGYREGKTDGITWSEI